MHPERIEKQIRGEVVHIIIRRVKKRQQILIRQHSTMLDPLVSSVQHSKQRFAVELGKIAEDSESVQIQERLVFCRRLRWTYFRQCLYLFVCVCVCMCMCVCKCMNESN